MLAGSGPKVEAVEHVRSVLVPEADSGDLDFVPDIALADGDPVTGRDYTIKAVFTPGHTSNHMAFRLDEERALFSGDHVMSWATSVIAPPDGHMAQYMASLRRLLDDSDRVYWPGHGPGRAEPQALVRAIMAHRQMREAAVLVASTRETLINTLAGGNPDNVTAELVSRAAAEGDPLAMELMEREGHLVGMGVVTAVHIFNPELVVLGGGVTNAGDLLFKPVRETVARRVQPAYRGTFDIVPAALGARSGALGAVAAAALATQDVPA